MLFSPRTFTIKNHHISVLKEISYVYIFRCPYCGKGIHARSLKKCIASAKLHIEKAHKMKTEVKVDATSLIVPEV